jgi:transcriptional regulator with PAS, ATPase and Fis domain
MQRAELVAHELGIADEVTFCLGFNREGVEAARRLEERGTEVIISRRSTAAMIEKALAIPNVSVPVTLEDVAQTLQAAKRITGLAQPQIAFFVPPNVQKDIESFARVLGFDFRIYPVLPDDDYLRLMVDRAIAEKLDVIAAGTVATVFANDRNFPSVLMDSGPVSLRTAFMEAKQVSYARRLEKIRTEYFRIIVDASYRGILVIDGRGAVAISNPAAHTILGRSQIENGMYLRNILPELDLSDCLGKGEPLSGLFLRTQRGPLVLDITPIMVAKTVRGAVIFFQSAETVTELGANTRKNLHSQGFSANYSFSSILGVSPQIEEARARAREFAESDGAVLLAGETGTGKELFAQSIHAASARRQGPFVAINCAAIPSSLLESEFFGYEEGAFTGAMRKGKPGLFEMAHMGTIFLDEISEMNKQSQLRLLRVLQERNVMRLGSARLIPVNFRIISATNKNLWKLVEQGTFRKDFYYRLNMLPLLIPPLRQRQGDIPVLARHFLRQNRKEGEACETIPQEHVLSLESYSWPGNVRELQNVMERYALHYGRGRSADTDIRNLICPQVEWSSLDGADQVVVGADFGDSLSGRERILRALRENNGHKGRAAEALGINRSTLYHRMARYGIR